MLAGVPVSAAAGRRARPATCVDDDGRPMVREVEVTRRLYRSGESEYLINGEVSRLRDVHELLMDTGLGAKAYAIIEQGKIGMILSSRPTDRRQLIEEAAGVTKYRARRRTAELKLDAAQQNLTRIDDIIFEVEKQRGTLKRQAAKARRYRGCATSCAAGRRCCSRAASACWRRPSRPPRPASPRCRPRKRPRRRAWPSARPTSSACASRSRGARATAREKREAAHAHEVEIGRLEQRIQGDEAQQAALARRAADIGGEIEALAARRGPAADELAAKQRDAALAGAGTRRRGRGARRRQRGAGGAAGHARRPRGRRRGRARGAVRGRQRGHGAPARHRERRRAPATACRATSRGGRPRPPTSRSRPRGPGASGRPRRRRSTQRPRAARRRHARPRRPRGARSPRCAASATAWPRPCAGTSRTSPRRPRG